MATKYNISDWVDYSSDKNQKTFRKAVHTILVGISGSDELKTSMIMKGGILLALRYGSSRFTRDIDFSTSTTNAEFNLDEFEKTLNKSIVIAVNNLNYGLDCVIQKCKKSPSRDDATFPTIQISVGYAYKSEGRAHKRLMGKQSSSIVKVDYSLNEPFSSVDILEIDEGNTIRTYTMTDLVAEKFRAILQQVSRNRNRRQDVYDLNMIFSDYSDSISKDNVLNSLKEKSQARGLDVVCNSMANQEVIKRSKSEYQNLATEIEGELPLFDDAYRAVREFYESLPW